jgi:hypothetical protein
MRGAPLKRTFGSSHDSALLRRRWDAEAGVWYSESDIPGLVIEADDLEEFERVMNEIAPELLVENGAAKASRVPINFSTKQEIGIANLGETLANTFYEDIVAILF